MSQSVCRYPGVAKRLFCPCLSVLTVGQFQRWNGKTATGIWESNPEVCLDKFAAEFRKNMEKLFQSALADWMELEAFVVPKLDYALCSTLAHKKWKELDRFVRRTVKRSLDLPGRVCHFLCYQCSGRA